MAKSKLKWFACHYAYDIPQYADFRVKAKNMADAERKVVAAFRAGKFERVRGEAWGNEEEHRVSVNGVADVLDMPTMQKLCQNTKS